MFKSIQELYKAADENNVAIGAFNTNNLETTQAIVDAGNDLKLPLIIQTTPKALNYAGFSELFAIARNLIDESPVPMTLHLDHAKEIDLIKKCLDLGYKSVMFDGSDLLFENNVAETKAVVELAHKYGAAVEAEIGAVGRGEEGRELVRQKFTHPDEAMKFAQLTGCDSLAVSIGNIHGAPRGEKLNVDLLKKINEIVEIPLVLHGASGLSTNDIKQAIDNGIRKVNIDTQLREAFKKGLEENVADENQDIRDYLSAAKNDVKLVVEKYLKLFNRVE